MRVRFFLRVYYYTSHNCFPKDIATNSTLKDMLNEIYGQRGDNFKLDQFIYSNDLLQEVIFSHLNQSFVGITVSLQITVVVLLFNNSWVCYIITHYNPHF